MDSLLNYSVEIDDFLICLVVFLYLFPIFAFLFHIRGWISWFSGLRFLGGKYKQKLIIVADAGTKPEEKHEVTETDLFFLLHPELSELFNKAETLELLDRLKGIVDKESKITEFEIHQSSMGSSTSTSKLFHVFNVFKTVSEKDGEFWWSLEKNLERIVFQRSRNKDDVKDKLYGEERIKIEPIKEGLKGKSSIKDLFGILLTHRVIQELYHIWGSNCQSLVSFVSKQFTEIGYEYNGWYYDSLFPHSEQILNQFFVENLQSLNVKTGVSECPPLFNLIYLEKTDILDEVMKSGNYDINTPHGGYTPLHFVLMLRKTKMAKHLLKDPINADPTTRDSQSGGNALHVALRNTREAEIIDLLLAHPKVKIDDVDGNGETALHYATNHNVIAVQKLIEKGANPNIQDKEGRSPLHRAACYGERKIVDLILQAQKQNHVDDDKAQNGATALHCAAESSNERMARYLMNKGADLHSRNNIGNTPLHYAAFHAKDMTIIDFFLRKMKDEDMNQYRNDVKLLSLAYRNENFLGAEIAARLFKRINKIQKRKSLADKILEVLCRLNDHILEVCLIPVCRLLITSIKTEFLAKLLFDYFRIRDRDRIRLERVKNSEEIDEILKRKGKFDINSRNLGPFLETPLFLAMRVSNVNTVRWLLERGADPTIRNSNGLTPFQVAATQKKAKEILDLLLATGKVDINDGGKSGYTLLHWAVATSNVTVVCYLLSKGANPNVADQNGATPLHVAAYCADKTDVLGLILEKEQVDINGRDKNGQTALHYAVGGKRVDNVRYLLEKGADPAISDENGLTPYQVAAAAVNQDSAILDLLRPNENKTEIGEGNNAEDLENVKLPPSQEDVVDVSLDNNGAQQDIHGQSEDISNPLKDAAEDGNPCDEFKVKFPRKRRAALDGQDSTQ